MILTDETARGGVPLEARRPRAGRRLRSALWSVGSGAGHGGAHPWGSGQRSNDQRVASKTSSYSHRPTLAHQAANLRH